MSDVVDKLVQDVNRLTKLAARNAREKIILERRIATLERDVRALRTQKAPAK